MQLGGEHEDSGVRQYGDCRITWRSIGKNLDDHFQREILTTLAGPAAEMVYSGIPLEFQNIKPWKQDLDSAWLKTLLEYVLPLQPRRAGLVNDYVQIMQLPIYPLEQITIPTLVIHAKDDSLVSIQQGRFSAENIPNARIKEFSSGGHLLLGQREGVRAEVETFLREATNESH